MLAVSLTLLINDDILEVAPGDEASLKESVFIRIQREMRVLFAPTGNEL